MNEDEILALMQRAESQEANLVALLKEVDLLQSELSDQKKRFDMARKRVVDSSKMIIEKDAIIKEQSNSIKELSLENEHLLSLIKNGWRKKK